MLAKLRRMLERILLKYKFPPDAVDTAVESTPAQAEALGESWA